MIDNVRPDRLRVYFGNVYLGWIDSKEHAEGAIRQHRAFRRNAGEHTARSEYRIESGTVLSES